jgi:hypothetical protein
LSYQNEKFFNDLVKTPLRFIHASSLRTCRLAVVDGDILLGSLGKVSPDRLERVRKNLARWISGA